MNLRTHPQRGEEHVKHRRNYEGELRRKGFRVVSEGGASPGGTQFVKIHTPFKMLCRMAEYHRVRKQLKDTVAKPAIAGQGVFSRLLARPSYFGGAVDQGVANDPDALSAPFVASQFDVC